MFAPILPRPTIPICMLVRSLFNGTCIEKYYPIAEVMAPTKIWRKGAGKPCRAMRWSHARRLNLDARNRGRPSADEAVGLGKKNWGHAYIWSGSVALPPLA